VTEFKKLRPYQPICTLMQTFLQTRRLYCAEWTQYSIRPKRSTMCNWHCV